MNKFQIPLRIVFYRDGESWVAHCLEFDLLGDGKTQEDALHLLGEAIGIQLEFSLERGNRHNFFCPAPGEYLEKFAQGRDAAVGNLEVVLHDLARRIPPDYVVETPQLREYRESEQECATA